MCIGQHVAELQARILSNLSTRVFERGYGVNAVRVVHGHTAALKNSKYRGSSSYAYTIVYSVPMYRSVLPTWNTVPYHTLNLVPSVRIPAPVPFRVLRATRSDRLQSTSVVNQPSFRIASDHTK